MTHKRLFEEFKKINNSVNIVNWLPLAADECDQYADPSEPKLKVFLEDGSWLRVYIDQKYHEITWY